MTSAELCASRKLLRCCQQRGIHSMILSSSRSRLRDSSSLWMSRRRRKRRRSPWTGSVWLARRIHLIQSICGVSFKSSKFNSFFQSNYRRRWIRRVHSQRVNVNSVLLRSVQERSGSGNRSINQIKDGGSEDGGT